MHVYKVYALKHTSSRVGKACTVEFLLPESNVNFLPFYQIPKVTILPKVTVLQI